TATAIAALQRPDQWKIGRTCVSRHVGIAIGIDSESASKVITAAAQVGRINQCASTGIQFADESARAAFQCRLEGICDREVSRKGLPGHVGISRCIDSNSGCNVENTAPKESGVDQCRAVAIEFGYKPCRRRAARSVVCRLKDTGCDREGRRTGSSCDKGV